MALVVRVLPRTRSSAPGSSPAASPPSSSSATDLDLDLARDAPDEWLASPSSDAHAQAHRGWLVLVWASVAPVPPEKPDRGERAFATLSRGVLELARDREGPVVAKIRLDGCDVRLCAPGGGGGGKGDAGGGEEDPDESLAWPANVTWRPKKHGAGKEKRWWKRLPIVVSHETRAVYRGERVVWCYALSDAAKEAWTVALHQEVVRSRAMMDRAVLSAASVAGPSREGGLRRGDRERKEAGGGRGGGAERTRPDAAVGSEGDPETAALIDHLTARAACATTRALSRAKDEAAFSEKAFFSEKAANATDAANASAKTAWASGGAAGAAVNAMLSRVLFDMQRSPNKKAEIRHQLGNLCKGVPDLPKFVGAITVGEEMSLGRSVPQVSAARLPECAASAKAKAKANTREDDDEGNGSGASLSAAPWDGGVLANRGPCAALELDVEFGGVAEMTLVTHIDLTAYAEAMGAGAEDDRDEGYEAAGPEGDPKGAAAGRSRSSEDGEEKSGEETSSPPSPSASSNSSSRRRFSTDSPAGGLEGAARSLAAAAKWNAAKLANAVARTIAKVPLSMTIRVKRLAGTVRVWIPPPPGDRLWFGFIGEPEMAMEASPSLGQLGIRWHGLAEKVSEIITAHLQREIRAALVLPNAGNTFLEPLDAYDDVPEISVRHLLEISKDARAAEGEGPDSPRPEPATKGKERAAREGGDEGVDDEAKARVVFHTPSSSALLEEVDVDDAIPPFADAPGARPESRGASKNTRADWTASAEPSPEGKKGKEDGLRVSTGTRPSGSPASPSDAPLLDFHFGKPRAAATTPRRATRPEASASASASAAASASASAASRSSPGVGGGGGGGFKLFGDASASFASRLAKAHSAMRADARHFREGLKEGGVKGGLDVAFGVGARVAKEMEAEFRSATGPKPSADRGGDV